jgi:hypothetical protein
LTDFALIWYLISSDFNQRGKLPKRRSSILPVRPSRGTRHVSSYARRVRIKRDSKAASTGETRHDGRFFCSETDDESVPRRRNALDAAIAGLGRSNQTQPEPVLSNPGCMEFPGSVHSRMNVNIKLHSSLAGPAGVSEGCRSGTV